MPGVRPASPGGRRRLAPFVLAAAVATACGAPSRVVLPDGPGTPLADPATLLEAATVTCRAVDTITAEAAMSGRVGGERVRGRLLLGADRRGRLRLEAVAPFGAPLLVLAASERGTTLVLPRDGRVLEGAALDDVLDALVAGTAPRRRQDLAQGGYFGGRRPEDGIIDWTRDAASIHNLVRAVAPPYPGALTTVGRRPARILRSRCLDEAAAPTLTPTLEARDGRLAARCGGGGTLQVLALEIDGVMMGPADLVVCFGTAPVTLGGPAESAASGARR